MKPLTNEIREKPRRNAEEPDADHHPAVKFFDPCGGATWLFTELGGDGDSLFGLCDLGMGFPELGYASLSGISGMRGVLGPPMERDRHFRASAPLSVYAGAARSAGGVVERGEHFDAALARWRERPRNAPEDAPDSPPRPGQPISAT